MIVTQCISDGRDRGLKIGCSAVWPELKYKITNFLHTLLPKSAVFKILNSHQILGATFILCGLEVSKIFQSGHAAVWQWYKIFVILS